MSDQKWALVTGGAGFVGSHLVDRLLKEGYRVLAIDNFITGRKENVSHLENNPNYKLLEADVIESVENYLTAEILAGWPAPNLELVFHLASPASPPRYQSHPTETYLVNSLGTHYLLAWLEEHQPQATFVYASSSEVYGDPAVHPQTESYWGNVNPNGPRACYDEGKRLGETICGVFSRDFGLDVRIARLFNTYGPRMDPDDGRVIPTFIKQAQSGLPYSIHGDGLQTRSYCYVSDLVDGLWRLATTAQAKGETVNLGNPEEYTILETAKHIHQLISDGSDFKTESLPLPTDDPTRRKPDITKATKLLSWEPVVDLRSGFKDMF